MEPRGLLAGLVTHARRATVGVAGLWLCACVTLPEPIPTLDAQHQEPELVTVRHRVEKGQTLYRIAKTYGLTVDELMAANGIDDPTTLKVGQELVVPGTAQLKPVAVADSPEPEPPLHPPAPPPKKGPVKVGRAEGSLSWPVRGVLYARFGRKGSEPHDGIDLAAPAGTPVKTAAPGKVLFAGDQKGYGLIAIVEHGNGLITLYAHNRDLRVKAGQQVREGQVLATVGDSGATSGPHLHFEVRRDGKPVDPLEHLGPVPAAP
ncbi:MAG: peptidoglycan DD-metalloendopeptidase family protein [Archangiaceae bacterium]|nr:peptidoglycan DD-metalloendopeptidase family protein [Archangiaceae bacterium]